MATVVKADTILAWHRKLIAQQWTSVSIRPGWPRVSMEIRRMAVRMATENSSWGNRRIQGELKHLGLLVARSTIAEILRENGIKPAPDRPTSWMTFIKSHVGSIAHPGTSASKGRVMPSLRDCPWIDADDSSMICAAQDHLRASNNERLRLLPWHPGEHFADSIPSYPIMGRLNNSERRKHGWIGVGLALVVIFLGILTYYWFADEDDAYIFASRYDDLVQIASEVVRTSATPEDAAEALIGRRSDLALVGDDELVFVQLQWPGSGGGHRGRFILGDGLKKGSWSILTRTPTHNDDRTFNRWKRGSDRMIRVENFGVEVASGQLVILKLATTAAE